MTAICHLKRHPILPVAWDQLYPYTADLLCLDSCRPQPAPLPSELSVVSTPLVVPAWEAALHGHPDWAFVRYLLDGLTQGFRIGFNRAHPLRSASANMGSAYLHPEVISSYLRRELSLGRMLGPFPLSFPASELHFNPCGVVPKGHNTGKWRLITNLSYPDGGSVNDGIDTEWSSLAYTTVDRVAETAVSLGRGALLAKVDIESAYRLIPVHPCDRPLQAVCWQGQVFVDPMLPFGLRSAPKIFTAVADALHWFLLRRGIEHVQHYLDDFIIMSFPDSPQCRDELETLLQVFRELGVPVAIHKTEGPSTCLVFLGIEIDTISGELRLPQDKLQRLQSLLSQWGDKRACSRKELESLIGMLNHACKVVRPGQSFLRRMIDLLHSGYVSLACNSAPIRLNAGFRADLAWWTCFLREWNGSSYLPPPPLLPEFSMASDASGRWGCGAWFRSSWIQLPWHGDTFALPIAVKEFLPILIAGVLWGRIWDGHRVRCLCDNQTVVACLRSRTSRDKGLMHLLRNLLFLEARFRFHVVPEYLDTHANHLADDLSRDRASSFLSKVPWAAPTPTPVPLPLVELLLDPLADWTSPLWRRQFSIILTRV